MAASPVSIGLTPSSNRPAPSASSHPTPTRSQSAQRRALDRPADRAKERRASRAMRSSMDSSSRWSDGVRSSIGILRRRWRDSAMS